MPAPIAVFAFNRPEHLRRVLVALAANDLAAQSDVTVFCDGPRHADEKAVTDAVRTAARAATGFRSLEVMEREKNLGCADSVIRGLEYMFSRHERLVVMEDDILCSPHALRFLNAGLEKYADEPVVFNVSAWSPPPRLMAVPPAHPFDAYFVPRFNCWGWASWRDRWQLVDWSVADYAVFAENARLRQAFNQGGDDLTPMLDAQLANKINSWAIRMDYARFRHGRLGLNPVVSYATNIGMGTGTHTTDHTARYDNDIAAAIANPRLPKHIFVDRAILAAYRKVYGGRPLWMRCIAKAARTIFRGGIS
ncbi:MAG: sugar transferase [Deltaproteobacteria bacterium]|jgi:hypothetical protein|nr:sugar transferase [Deltaproteobacteria bacterium]